ncbi:hypothetical protein NKH99_25460 [Mesorhizobium sp. M0854]|uniref:hypothetical protein n=1 Tax=Mesorhizobium sp. M0854 TaxID=2957013 RepID=UPI0033355427
MTNRNLYRALFPPHYSPRLPPQPDDSDWSRQWYSLNLPYIRVMGPLWSFGVKLKKSGAVKILPGGKGDAAALALGLLFQDGNAAELGSLNAYHRPALFRAEIESFLQPIREGKGKEGKYSETRLSLLAVDTIDGKHASGDQLIQLDEEDVGFSWDKNNVPESSDPILVSTFGDNPPPKLNKKAEIDATYLPAMQLIQGRIRYKPNSAYLARVRTQLGLNSPAGVPNGDQVVLLPDGFCVAGSNRLPWESAEISGWFKATFRNFDGAPRVERALRLWFDPEAEKEAGKDYSKVEGSWRKSVDKLQQALQQADEVTGGPAWLEVSPNSEIHPEDLFWTETMPKEEDWPLFSRSPAKDYAVGLDTAGLFVRLSDRAGGSGAVTNLTIQPKSFTVETSGAKSVRISGTAGIVSNGADKVHAKYEFDSKIRDKLTVGAGKLIDKPVPLALPLIETAEIVRRACDLPQPAPADELGLLWAFTPVKDGWLHWPLPNATAPNIGSLIGDAVRSASEQRVATDYGSGISITGALAFGNSPGRSGFTEAERPWSLALSDVQGAEFYFDLLVEGEPEKIGSILEARVKLDNLLVSFDGIFLATAFRQTPERLLPEKAERALGTFGLRGVSPSNLRGIEDQMWKQSTAGAAQAKVRLAVSVNDLTVVTTDKGRGNLGANTEVSLLTEMAGTSDLAKSWGQSMVPWVWREHDRLPVVQSLPVAAAGRARNAPSYARALAPLRLANPPAKNGQLTYLVAGLDMTRPWLDLTVSSSGKAATFVKPVGQGSWRDETVMAPTTLPSVSFVVGADPRPGASKVADDWNGLPTAVSAEFRYDVALRDEHNAFQRAPAPPARRGEPKAAYDSEGPTVDAVFAPLPNNGPDNGPETRRRTNGWDAVRLSVNRKAALAALDDRNMISSVKDSLFLSGLFGDINYRLKKQVEVSPEPTFSGGQPDGERLVEAIGRLRMEFKSAIDTSGTMALDLLGLPAGSDLVGLAGKFLRLQDPSDVRFGTAFATAKGGWFIDQYGLRSAFPSAKDVVVRKIQAPVPDGEDFKLGDETRLVTLVKPIEVDGRKLRFWCADVPVTGDSADATLARFTTAGPIEDRANAFTRGLNHLAGFRWMFDEEDMVGGFVIIDGFAFEPMELIEFHQKGEELPTWVKVHGRLHVPVRLDGKSPPLDAGPATLTLEADGKGRFGAKLEATDVVLPLANPETFDGVAPVLEVASLPQPNDDADATLRFALGGEEFACGVRVAREADGGISFVKFAAEPKPSPNGSIDFKTMRGRMGRAERKDDGELGLTERHQAALYYAVVLGEPGAQLSGDCKLDLLADRFGNSGTCELEWRFSAKEAISNIGVRRHVFSTDVFVVHWSADQPSGSFLGAAKVAPFRGAAIATLKQRKRAEEDFPSFEISQSRLRAYMGLTVDATANTAPASLVLTYENDVGYRLAGTLKLYSALTWPRLKIEALGSDWQVASFSANPKLGGRFAHEATIRFDGQRLMPLQLSDPVEEADFAIPLMVDVEHRVTSGEAGREVGIGQSITWRTFQVVRLWPRSLFVKALAKWATPADTSPPAIRKERTGVAPWQDKLASPIAEYAAGGSVFQIAAVNNGGLSGNLAKALAEYLPASIAVEFSDHVLLAFSPEARGYAKLGANPVLCSLPALGFAGADSLPSDQALPLSRMLACRPEQDTKVFLGYADRYEAHVFPALDPRLVDEAISRARQAPARRTREVADIPCAATDFDGTRAHRAVFQSLTFKQVDKKLVKVPVDDMPTAATAFHLSSLFENQTDKKTGALLDPSPLAIGFVGSGHVGGRDFYIRPDENDNPLEKGSDFTRIDYASALARLRDWGVRNIVAGPVEPSHGLNEAMDADATWTVLLETRSRDGSKLISAAETKITVRESKDVETLKSNSGAWAISALQRAAPWARVGLLTMRRQDFGLELEEKWVEVIEGADLRDMQITTRKLSPNILVAPQPQMERWPVHDQPAAPTGYMPADIGPALFASDDLKEPMGAAGGARLTATGVETAWRLVYGPHAILEDRTDKDVPDPDPYKPRLRESESFWIADRERVGFRPFALAPDAGPFDLSFALPTGFDEASPRALQPASVVAVPKREAVERKAYEQAYAPAIIGTSRISVRPGAWMSMRTGFSHVRFKDEELHLARSSEAPVNLRLPRPPLLAVNDRPRGSSHEEGRHVVVSTTQNFMLHGPRAARPGENSLPVGLDRAPRSLFATKLELASPADGVFPPDWDGSIAVSVAQWFGTVEGAIWEIKNAALVAAGQRFLATKIPERKEDKEIKPDDPYGRTFFFREFSGAPGFLRGMPPATQVEFELNVECREASVRLYRQARFTLLTTGTGVARIETPVFTRFDDPEFNDMLGGLAKVERRRSAYDAASDFVLAADVGEMRPDYRLEVALAVLPARAGDDVGLKFRATDGPDGNKALAYEIDKGMTPKTKLVRLVLSRKRSGEDARILTPAGDRQPVTGARFVIGNQQQAFLLDADPDTVTWFHPLTIECSALMDGDRPGLAPDDQLSIDFFLGEWDKDTRPPPFASLLIDVSDRPTLTANPSAFTLVAYSGPKQQDKLNVALEARFSAALYANGPEPTLIEIVDPRDMLDGLVRRRGTYLWRTYDTAADQEELRYALQKLNLVGASWLPNDLDGSWYLTG